MIRDIITAQIKIETLEFGPSQIAWIFQCDSFCFAHPGLFPKLVYSFIFITIFCLPLPCWPQTEFKVFGNLKKINTPVYWKHQM